MPGVRAHDKCTRVCKHFKLVFRYAAVDCTTAARIRGLLRLRLIVRRGRCPRRLLSTASSASHVHLSCRHRLRDSSISRLFHEPPSCSSLGGQLTLAHPRALLTLQLTGPHVWFLPD